MTVVGIGITGADADKLDVNALLAFIEEEYPNIFEDVKRDAYEFEVSVEELFNLRFEGLPTPLYIHLANLLSEFNLIPIRYTLDENGVEHMYYPLSESYSILDNEFAFEAFEEFFEEFGLEVNATKREIVEAN